MIRHTYVLIFISFLIMRIHQIQMSSEYKNNSTDSELYDGNSLDSTVNVTAQEDRNQESTSRLQDDINGLTIDQLLSLPDDDGSEYSETSLEGDLYFIYIYIYILQFHNHSNNE